MSLFFLFVWYYMYKLTKTCFILIARFSLRKKDFFFSVIRSFFIIFLQKFFSDFIPPFFNIKCVHVYIYLSPLTACTEMTGRLIWSSTEMLSMFISNSYVMRQDVR